MRKALVLAVMAVVLAGAAYAELQSVQVGGLIEMRGRYIINSFNQTSHFGVVTPQVELRGPAWWFQRRALGANSVTSRLGWDSDNNDWAFTEITTSVNFQANFTENVSAFMELYMYNVWGDNFRSNYLTGQDFRAVTNNDVWMLQSYIDMKEVFGQPLELKIGRQCMSFGNKFLIADKSSPTQRISFDGIRATYKPMDKLTLDAWWAKLAENSPVEEDGDVDFYGVYATYEACSAASVSAYWMLVRDAASRADTRIGATSNWWQEQIEDAIGIDDYDVTNLNTVGLRVFGKTAGFDYNAEAAFQFGDASADGVNFRRTYIFPNWTYGDDDANWGEWGMDAELGYTFDSVAWKPRVFIGGAHFGGEDNRDISFFDWLNPFSRPDASISFSRLFSDTNYAPVMQDNGEMSNFNQIRFGVNLTPTEKISVMLRAQQIWADATFDWPTHVRFGKYRYPIAPALSFWTQESSDDLGFEIDAVLKYQYSKDLLFSFYWGHLFTGEAMRDGNYVLGYGNQFNGGTAKSDADYVLWWATLKF